MAPAYVDELDFGFGWIPPGEGFMRRCSHALVVEGRVWVIDPVWDDEALERARGLGEPGGVVQLLDRHGRDCARAAQSLGVPHHVVPPEPPDDAPFAVLPVVRNRFWQEVAIWFPEQRTLVAADAVGTAQFYRAPGERLGVSPALRLRPPRSLLRVAPERVLVGHGEGVLVDADAALREAVGRARSRLPAWLWGGFRAHGPGGSRRR